MRPCLPVPRRGGRRNAHDHARPHHGHARPDPCGLVHLRLPSGRRAPRPRRKISRPSTAALPPVVPPRPPHPDAAPRSPAVARHGAGGRVPISTAPGPRRRGPRPAARRVVAAASRQPSRTSSGAMAPRVRARSRGGQPAAGGGRGPRGLLEGARRRRPRRRARPGPCDRRVGHRPRAPRGVSQGRGIEEAFEESEDGFEAFIESFIGFDPQSLATARGRPPAAT